MCWRQKSAVICRLHETDASGRKTAVTKTEAQRIFDELVLDRLELYNIHPHVASTVAEFWRFKFEPAIRARLRPGGYMHYEGMMRTHLLPTALGPHDRPFGETRMRDVDYSLLQELILKRKAQGYSPQTLLHIKHVLSAFFRAARRFKWYVGDLPTDGLEVGEITTVRPTKALTLEQANAIIASLESPYREMVITLLVLGLRIGELCGLRWKYVNLTSEWAIVDGGAIPPLTMAVRWNWVMVKEPTGAPKGEKQWRWISQYGPLKKKTSPRDVPLPQLIVDMLLDWQQKTEFRGPDDPVFASSTGRPIDHHNAVKRVLKPVGIALGMTNAAGRSGQLTTWLSWHCLRRTANTIAGMVGMTIAERKRVFGWSVDRMAIHYDRTSVEQTREGMERVAEPFREYFKEYFKAMRANSQIR